MNASNTAPPLQGQTALVVQAHTGIGAAVAEAFAAAGAKVMINYLHENAGANQVAQRIRIKQGHAMIFQADVSQENQVKSMFDVLVAYWGGLNILVTNTELDIDGWTGNINPEQWRGILIQNLSGQFLCVRQAMREFSRQGSRPESPSSAANILCVSSLQNVSSPPGQVRYAVCKAEMSSLFNAFASELNQENIDIALASAITPCVAEYAYSYQTPAIASGSTALISREQQDIATTAVGLAALV
ncbi:SDR family NAD(P)-dependent oxidoreductase [Methylomonas albis]|uniref:SDR family NAD(P)-dependent oxidoreductase n=1 Tax=Methylomonas albis TaxID=1854563 RepID=A0ABR9D3W8_9GAMM|nr:SDR family NAD(P)-dependent oxidoreductase [Methylomonas albis]MBD9357814.1 SDR family NAD(P)-dependent oxidoreductase [Methylomonas albis]